MSSNTSDPGRIERDLDQTRSRLGSHLSELQDRLSPGQVLDDAMNYFRGSEGADFGRNLLDSVRANPLPAALTGIGLAWLMATGPRGGTSAAPAVGGSSRVRVYGGAPGAREEYDSMALRLHTAEQTVTRAPDEDEHVYVTRRDDARGEAVGLKRQAQESAQSFGQRIRDAISSAQEATTRGLHDAQARAGDAAGSLTSAAQGAMQSVTGVAQRAGGGMSQGGQAASDAGARLASAIGDSPVLLGALGLAAGALLGALLPVTEQETSTLGGVAGQARDTARALAQQALDRGGQVAQAVIDTGRDSAAAQGLTGGKSAGDLLNAAASGQLSGQAAQVAKDVLNASEEAVRGQAGAQKPA